MATLSELHVENIKKHMLHEEDALRIKFKARNSQFDTKKVLHAEVEEYEKKGWIAGTPLKTKTPISLKKSHSRQLEDDIWCMFYNLGFRILNGDEKLKIQWGENNGENQQIDVLAVGEDAIFAVECKSAEKPKPYNFKKDIIEISKYQEGVTKALQQVYGNDKKVKFIFATRNYNIPEDSEDAQRLRDYGVYHMNENSYQYINNLIKSYKSSVLYQFYGLMFKDELISDQPITIPALQGKMGDKAYYLFSIKPSTLLKIGFVLHRTRVNDSMAPTYQRLLNPNRLKGITKFIDKGGYFPNSIIINFADPNENLQTTFEAKDDKEESSKVKFGLLHIPNAYGIAYIIDGQHRVYGYANSQYKDNHTIPVVAFQNMASEEQLKIFMDINENQKSVSKNLRIDLEEDLFWTSPRLDSRMRALRSSIIKALCCQPGTVLYNKISIGEDQAKLSSVFFDKALLSSGLIPTAKNMSWIGDTRTSLYNINNTNDDAAMTDAKKRICQFIQGCYDIADHILSTEIKDLFLFSNRATYPFVTLAGLLHTFLININEIKVEMSVNERLKKLSPYIETLCNGLNSLPEEEIAYLRGIQGQGAEKKWLLAYQNIINKTYSDYCPEELQEWKETRDQTLQSEGEDLKDTIRILLQKLFFIKLDEVFKENAEKSVAKLKNACEGKIIAENEDNEDFDLSASDWKEWIEVSEFKEQIEKYYSFEPFEQAFGISITGKEKSRKDKLAWFSLIEPSKGRKKVPLTQNDVNKLWLIHEHLMNYLPTEK